MHSEPSETQSGNDLPQPQSIASAGELVDWFGSLPTDSSVLPIAGCTKLSRSAAQAAYACDLRLLRGITAYDPSEFLITAAAGTPMQEIVSALAGNGQYLPADPCLLAEGATLGGTLAAGISGPSRLLYGSLRDFVMEVQFLDGLGKLVRGGGKVVKNAAGFDFPKLMVGSLGRLGVITEATLKVFPRPAATATVRAHIGSASECVAVTQALQAQPVPITAINFGGEQPGDMYIRIAGPKDSQDATLRRIETIVRGAAQNISAAERLLGDSDQACWETLRDAALRFPRQATVRTCQMPGKVPELDAALSRLELPRRYWSGGEVCWVELGEANQDELHKALLDLQISGFKLPMLASPKDRIGNSDWIAAANRIKTALDPNERFLAF